MDGNFLHRTWLKVIKASNYEPEIIYFRPPFVGYKITHSIPTTQSQGHLPSPPPTDEEVEDQKG